MTEKTKGSFIELIPLLKPYSKDLVIGGICILFYVGCWPLLASIAGRLIPAIGSGDIDLVIKLTLNALIIFFIQKVAQFGQDTILSRPALYVSQELRLNLFKRLQRIKIGSLNKLSSGDITYRLTEDADRVGEVIYKTIQDTTPSVLQLAAVLGYMVYIDWQLSIATLILAPFISLLISRFGQRVMIASEKSQKEVSNLAGLLTESIQGIPLVRAYAVEDWLQGKFSKRVGKHREAKYKNLKLTALQHPVIGFIEAAGILSILLIGALRIRAGGLNSEEFSSYFAAILMLIDPISHITTNYNELQQGKASLLRLKEIELAEVEKINVSNNIQMSSSDIVFDNVSFSYNQKEKVINNINLKIEKGKVIALVGPSGAGKSTLFSMLLKFIEPNEGSISFGNVSFRNISSSYIRKQMALVPQTNFVFSGSITEAIRFGRKVPLSEVHDAARIANAEGFINQMPSGFETKLDERGQNLSGGQLQRLAIARALIGNPSVLLLDEATSALDAESEEAVQIGLKQAMLNRTVIVIAHRLSTVQEADQIVVLDKGTVSEIGTHDNLIAKKGRYRELCERQFIRSIDT